MDPASASTPLNKEFTLLQKSGVDVRDQDVSRQQSENLIWRVGGWEWFCCHVCCCLSWQMHDQLCLTTLYVLFIKFHLQVCVCVGWKKVKQDFVEELYKAQVWPVTLLCFSLQSDMRFIHFPGIKQRPHRCICYSVLLCATSQFAKTCEIWRRIQLEVWIQSDTSWRACWVESAVVWKLKVEKCFSSLLVWS